MQWQLYKERINVVNMIKSYHQPVWDGDGWLLGAWGRGLAGGQGDGMDGDVQGPGSSRPGSWSEPGDVPMCLVPGMVKGREGRHLG